MAVYYCEGCDKLVDGDWHPMAESGLCDECECERDEEESENE